MAGKSSSPERSPDDEAHAQYLRQVDDEASKSKPTGDQEYEGDITLKTKSDKEFETHEKTSKPSMHNTDTGAPPLPSEALPPLPLEAPPAAQEDDGWAPVWEDTAQAFYFYNRFTGATQWTNPRVPEATQPAAPGVDPSASIPPAEALRPAGGYDPAIHGDYDPTAWYAQTSSTEEPSSSIGTNPTDAAAAAYAATGAFNRYTGRWQAAEINPENFNDETKSKRQMNAYFDVDAAANSHDGRSLKAERSGMKLSKRELKDFKEKRKAKKEEKRRAWLRD